MSAPRRPYRALPALLTALLLVLAAPAAVAAPTPGGGPCPYAVAPGPPVSDSEVPAPGDAPPEPLPVPAEPVGGPAMGLCGDIAAQGAPAPPNVPVESYVVADLDSGAVLAARNPHARLRPASLMKALTGLVVARDLPMEAPVVGTQADADQVGTRVGVEAGGQYTVRQLLDAMMMASGNDAAHALAVAHSGSVEATLEAMNRTATSMGALDTRAATPSGLDGPGMQTSAYDMASIFRVAMREPEFARAVSSRETALPGVDGGPPVPVSNDNRLLRDYPGAIGGKTGFTDDSRHTYIGAAERDGRRLVAVLMRGEQRPIRMTVQAAALLDYGFARSEQQSIASLTDAAAAPASSSAAPPSEEPPEFPRTADDVVSDDSDWSVPLVIAGLAGLIGVLLLAVARRSRR